MLRPSSQPCGFRDGKDHETTLCGPAHFNVQLGCELACYRNGFTVGSRVAFEKNSSMDLMLGSPKAKRSAASLPFGQRAADRGFVVH